MVNCKLLTLVLALGLFGSVHAGYAQLAPPETWSKTPTATLIRVAANDAGFPGGVRSGYASFNTGFTPVKVPAAYRFASNAGRFAAAAAFGWPAAFLLAGGLAYQYFTDADFESDGLRWLKKSNQITCPTGTYFLGTKCASGMSVPGNQPVPWNQVISTASGRYSVQGTVPENQCFRLHYTDHIYAGSTMSFPASQLLSCVNQTSTPFSQPVSRQEFEDTMAPRPVPLGVPQVWPLQEPMWWPVDPKPIINPSPAPVPATNPLPVPVPQPLRIPQGEPIQVPNPNYDPVTDPNPYVWRQPVIDVVPSPTVDDPWRVDVQPKDIIKSNPHPLTDPESVPDPANDPNSTPSENPDLCASNPDILACQKLDTPDADTIPETPIDVVVTPDSGWGGNGSCPAPKMLTVQGRNIPIPYDLFCQYMSGIRPIIIALAWLSAGFILIGARGGD